MTIEVIDAHLHVWDETAAGKDPGPMAVGYSAQSVATLELFQDYPDLQEEDLQQALEFAAATVDGTIDLQIDAA